MCCFCKQRLRALRQRCETRSRSRRPLSPFLKGHHTLMRVSLPLAAEGGRIRVALAALCAMALLGIAAAVTPPSAHAAFTLAECQGGPTKGEGSSLQATAQEQVWTLSVFYTSFGCGSGAVSTSPVSYKSDGSGCGIASIGGGPQTEEKCSTFQAGAAKAGERASETRFAASDAPLTPAQKSNAEAAGGTNPGVLHQIPVAVAAVTVIVHFPEGCSLENPEQAGGNGNTTTGGPNDPGGADGTGDKSRKTPCVCIFPLPSWRRSGMGKRSLGGMSSRVGQKSIFQVQTRAR